METLTSITVNSSKVQPMQHLLWEADLQHLVQRTLKFRSLTQADSGLDVSLMHFSVPNMKNQVLLNMKTKKVESRESNNHTKKLDWSSFKKAPYHPDMSQQR